jgi:hypothetical protein
VKNEHIPKMAISDDVMKLAISPAAFTAMRRRLDEALDKTEAVCYSMSDGHIQTGPAFDLVWPTFALAHVMIERISARVTWAPRPSKEAEDAD